MTHNNKKVYSQLVLQREHDRDFHTVCAISNYNKTVFCLYGGHLNSPSIDDSKRRTLWVSTPHEPKESFVYTLAIMMHEYERLCSEGKVTTWGPTAEEDEANEEKEAKAEEEDYREWVVSVELDLAKNPHRGPRDEDDSDGGDHWDQGDGDKSLDSITSSSSSYYPLGSDEQSGSNENKDGPRRSTRTKKKSSGVPDMPEDTGIEDKQDGLPLQLCKAVRPLSSLPSICLCQFLLRDGGDQITYDWDVKGATGDPLFYTDRKKLLPRMTSGAPHQTKAATSTTIPTTIRPLGKHPHLVFKHILGQGVVGQVLRATCSGHKVDVAVKLVDLANKEDLREVARSEAEMYEGPLLALQGDVVPRFYGLFLTPTTPLALLVMEYVGTPLAECRLSEVDDITK